MNSGLTRGCARFQVQDLESEPNTELKTQTSGGIGSPNTTQEMRKHRQIHMYKNCVQATNSHSDVAEAM